MEYTKYTKTLALPIAIVIAGALIAGAIILTKRTPAGTTAQTPRDQAIATATAAGIKTGGLKSCIDNRDMQERVDRDSTDGKALGINGTPYNVIVGPNNIRFAVPGAFPIEFFEKVIDLMDSGAGYTTAEYELTDVENVYNSVMVENLLPRIKNDSTAVMAAVNPAIDHIRGNTSGEYMIVEYSDFECPYCQVHHETMRQLIANDSRIGWVYRHFPLSSIHKGAQLKAEAAECIAAANGNDAFWAYADKNFETLGTE